MCALFCQVVLRLKCEVPLRELGRCVVQRDPQAQPRPCLTALEAVLREVRHSTTPTIGLIYSRDRVRLHAYYHSLHTDICFLRLPLHSSTDC